MDRQDFPPRTREQSALVVYREWLTWPALKELPPNIAGTVARLDPGPQEGYISLRSFRGSVIDAGRYFKCGAVAKSGTTMSHYLHIEGPPPREALTRLILQGIAWCVETTGPGRGIGWGRTNTGMRGIAANVSQRGHVSLTTQLRGSDGRFTATQFHIGAADGPDYAERHEAAANMMREMLEVEEGNRPFRIETDRRWWLAKWSSAKGVIRRKRHRAQS